MNPRVAAALALMLACAGAHAQEPAKAGADAIRFVELDGRRVRIQTLGLTARRAGAPVVVFEAGATNSLDAWARVIAEVGATTPALAYDRAGLGQSDWDERPPTPEHANARLRRLLAAIGAAPPYVLVGHSWGGVLAHAFAGRHPAEIAGLVFVDPAPIVTASLSERLAPFEAVGAGRAAYDSYWDGFVSLFKTAPPGLRAELEVVRQAARDDIGREKPTPLPEVPVAVVLAAKYLPVPALETPFDPRAHFEADVRHRIRLLQDWALASPRGTLLVSNSTTHTIARDEPDLIVWAIRRVLDQITR